MKFNEIKRGHRRESNSEDQLYEVLDAGFICTLAVNVDGVPMMIPTAYGRKADRIYLHGSTKNHLLNQAIEANQICISVQHTDGLVLAQTLYNTSINYRSATIFGTASLVTDEAKRMEALQCITENIIPGRWDEVKTGTDAQLKSTMVIEVPIESASVKIRAGDPEGDEDLNEEVWSGYIPLKQIALPPVYDPKRLQFFGEDESVQFFYLKNKFND